MGLFAEMWLTMTTTRISNVNFIIYTTNSDTILKICQIILLNMENQNLWFSFANNKLFFLYIHFILNWFK